jgi:hypothetical protein
VKRLKRLSGIVLFLLGLALSGSGILAANLLLRLFPAVQTVGQICAVIGVVLLALAVGSTVSFLGLQAWDPNRPQWRKR